MQNRSSVASMNPPISLWFYSKQRSDLLSLTCCHFQRLKILLRTSSLRCCGQKLFATISFLWWNPHVSKKSIFWSWGAQSLHFQTAEENHQNRSCHGLHAGAVKCASVRQKHGLYISILMRKPKAEVEVFQRCKKKINQTKKPDGAMFQE